MSEKRTKHRISGKKQKKLRVAAYCRVSTLMDAQDTSFELQCEHYRGYITGREDSDGLLRQVIALVQTISQEHGNVRSSPLFPAGIRLLHPNQHPANTADGISRAGHAECASDLRSRPFVGNPLSICTLFVAVLALPEGGSSAVAHLVRRHQVPSDAVAFFLCDGGHQVEQQLVARLRRIDPLLLEEYPDAQRLQAPDCRHALAHVARKPSDGLREDQVDPARLAVRQQPPKLRPPVHLPSRFPVVTVDAHQLVNADGTGRTKNRGEREQYYLEEHHTPLIPPEVFDHVQKLLESTALWENRRNVSPEQRALLEEGKRLSEEYGLYAVIRDNPYIEEKPYSEGKANPQQSQQSDTAPAQASNTAPDKELQERPNNDLEEEDGKIQ